MAKMLLVVYFSMQYACNLELESYEEEKGTLPEPPSHAHISSILLCFFVTLSQKKGVSQSFLQDQLCTNTN